MKPGWVLFDWGDTLIVDSDVFDGPMVDWPQVQAVDHARDTLVELRSRGWHVAVATNAAQSGESQVRQALARVDLDELVDRVFTSFDVGHKKPTTEYFNYIRAATGGDSALIVMVGDNPGVDVIGANRAGLPAVWLRQPNRELPGHSMRREIDSLSELPDLLERWVLRNPSPVVSWREGTVNRAAEYIALAYGPGFAAGETDYNPVTVALVGPPYRGQVAVEFLVDRADPSNRQAVDAAIREIEFYLMELDHDDPWAYCAYHCSTMANVYSDIHWGGFMSDVERQALRFSGALRRFRGFDRRSFTIGELEDGPRDWDWGTDRGVYCFVVDDEVVYVGRALGCTLGERIADQLRHKEHDDWAAVVERLDNRIEIFVVGKDEVFLAAALEAYLIEVLEPHPRFNSRVC